MTRFIFPIAIVISAILIPIASNAQTEFVKYKKYLIPLAPTGPCAEREIAGSKSSLEAVSAADNGPARVFVTTDIGAGDPDDKQSLVHILDFADQLKILGFSANGPGTNSVTIAQRKGVISQFISKYPGLLDLQSKIYSGTFDQLVPVDGIAIEQTSESAQQIIEAARCTFWEDGYRPLYVLGWGTSTDVMQALEAAPDIRKVVRVVNYSTSPNDTAQQHAWFDNPDQNDIWRAEYRGLTRPLANCTQSDMAALSNKPNSQYILTNTSASWNKGGIVFNGSGATGSFAPFTGEPYTGSSWIEDGEFPPGGCLLPPGASRENKHWTKLGDTITTMFVLNTPSQRQNPHLGTTYGTYDKLGNTRWALRDERFQNIETVYSSWIAK